MSNDDHPHLLIVEGADDMRVISHLKEICVPSLSFKIQETKGIKNLLDAIEPQIKVQGRLALGILTDANDDPQARWQAISDRIVKAQAQPPAHSGMVIEGTPRIGVWMMPDNVSSGELENFIAKLIPDEDPIWPRAKDYVDSIPERDRPFKPGKILKAQIHAWLATRTKPRPMGSALEAGDLNIEHPLAQDITRWLTELFRPE